MLKELLNRIDTKREIQIKGVERGVYTDREQPLLYEDNTEHYKKVEKKERTLTVSTVNSLISFIKEELKRLNNETGNKTTLIINSKGGQFSADDDFSDITCTYNRKLTVAWELLEEVANTTLSHEALLTILQKFRPYIYGFEVLYKTLLDIRVIGRSEMVSNPVFVPGENGNEAKSGYRITFKLQSGEQDEVELPNKFNLILPYAKGRLDKTYVLPIELMYLNNGSGKIQILFQCAELEEKEEEALKDEIDYIKEKLSDVKELLILQNC